MNTFDYLFCKARENGKVAKALSDKLMTDVDKNNLIKSIDDIDVGAIVQATVRTIGYELKDIVNNSNISNYRYSNNLGIVKATINADSIGSAVFSGCFSMIEANIKANTSGNSIFQYCISLKNVSIDNLLSIGSNMFINCISLVIFKLLTSEVVTLENITAFTNTPIANGTGFIYVLDNLVDSYKTATNWSVYADQIRPMSECEE